MLIFLILEKQKNCWYKSFIGKKLLPFQKPSLLMLEGRTYAGGSRPYCYLLNSDTCELKLIFGLVVFCTPSYQFYAWKIVYESFKISKILK